MLMVKLKLNFERKETILKKEITEKKKMQTLALYKWKCIFLTIFEFQELPFIAERKIVFLVRSQVIFWEMHLFHAYSA